MSGNGLSERFGNSAAESFAARRANSIGCIAVFEAVFGVALATAG
jgi:hypothetical protein